MCSTTDRVTCISCDEIMLAQDFFLHQMVTLQDGFPSVMDKLAVVWNFFKMILTSFWIICQKSPQTFFSSGLREHFKSWHARVPTVSLQGASNHWHLILKTYNFIALNVRVPYRRMYFQQQIYWLFHRTAGVTHWGYQVGIAQLCMVCIHLLTLR